MQKNTIKTNYKHTIFASYIAYFTQAIIVNFTPLLFLTFQKSFDISVGKITLLVVINFGTQLIVDFIAAKQVDKIGYRKAIVIAHILAGIGLVGLGTLPDLLPNPYAGLVLSTIIFAIGGGLIEVLVTPIVEACPTDEKASSVSLLHSFYSWGHVAVILLSTLLFAVLGLEHWRIIAVCWAVVPFFNAFYFSQVPIFKLVESGESMTMKQLFKTKLFWIFIILMISSGAAEQAMNQWSSTFVESGLNISKSIGDILGPCIFAISMGASRVINSVLTKKFKLWKIILISAILCIIAYLLVSLSPFKFLSLIGCALCGFSVGAFWPGTFSMASIKFPKGGISLFALLSLAGDVGCFVGPSLIGSMTRLYNNDLKFALLFGAVFPMVIIICIFTLNNNKRKKLLKR